MIQQDPNKPKNRQLKYGYVSSNVMDVFNQLGQYYEQYEEDDLGFQDYKEMSSIAMKAYKMMLMQQINSKMDVFIHENRHKLQTIPKSHYLSLRRQCRLQGGYRVRAFEHKEVLDTGIFPPQGVYVLCDSTTKHEVLSGLVFTFSYKDVNYVYNG